MSECTTHHKACDCREEATRKLVNELLSSTLFAQDSYWYKELRAESVRLGYAQARSDRPAGNRLLQDCDIKCKTAIPNCDRTCVRCTAKPAAQGEGEG